ncbi:MAG: AAA family ATPase [Firmicutes bacterium]|nr:AAA family ATPase [Bacillota bacterium]
MGKFRVAEALPGDVRRNIARVSPLRFEAAGVSPDAVAAVTGARTTYVRFLPALSSQCRENEILMDGVIRENAGTTLRAEVTVSLVTPKDAQSVLVNPLADLSWMDDHEQASFLRRYLMGIPMAVEDKVVVALPGAREVPFRVVGTAPSGCVVVGPGTAVRIQRQGSFGDSSSSVAYEDIGGLSEQVKLVREITELPLLYPDIFARIGIEPPRGILLFGPPGTGKTLIARAVAHESGAHFVHVNGPEIVNKYYGETEARLRELFDEARRKAPSILFLDELDAIAPKRSEAIGDVEKRVVGQLLALMDGLVSRGQVVVIGATNMPSLLDPALRRPGRFDREIVIPVPDTAGRLEILRIHTRGMALDEDVDLGRLAAMTHGYVGADIASLCREAGMLALRRVIPELPSAGREERERIASDLRVSMKDFIQASRAVRPSVTREFFTEIPDTTWADVGGLEEIKAKVEDVVILPLRNPQAALHLGTSAVRGLLFFGPSGTGKTLVARAMAREAGVNFLSISGAVLFSRWFGETERGLHELFDRAKQASPCILCIDEVDSLASMRSGTGAAAERAVSQLLVELDSMDALTDLVIVGTTNRMDLMDPAFLRPGRFDLAIEFPLPNAEDRAGIFEVHLRGRPLGQEVDIERLAVMSEGLTGAHISGICRRASFLALRDSVLGPSPGGVITMAHLLRATEEVIREREGLIGRQAPVAGEDRLKGGRAG